MNIRLKIERSVRRSEKAYQLYLENRMYYQALRIFKANILVYELLEEFLFECENSEVDIVIDYLYHLEDWFENFESSKRAEIELEEKFAFERLENSLPYPEGFLEKILKNNV